MSSPFFFFFFYRDFRSRTLYTFLCSLSLSLHSCSLFFSLSWHSLYFLPHYLFSFLLICLLSLSLSSLSLFFFAFPRYLTSLYNATYFLSNLLSLLFLSISAPSLSLYSFFLHLLVFFSSYLRSLYSFIISFLLDCYDQFFFLSSPLSRKFHIELVLVRNDIVLF